MMFVVHAAFPLEPDYREEGKQLFAAHAKRSRQEDGNIDYRVVVDIEDPNLIHTIERWEDDAAFDTHENSDHNRKFQEDVADFQGGDPEVTQFYVESVSTLE